MFGRLIPSVSRMMWRPAVAAIRMPTPAMQFSSGRKRKVQQPPKKKTTPKPSNPGKTPEERKQFAKQSIEEILRDIDITSAEMTEKEADKLKELDKIFTENPELRDMTVEDLIGMLNLSEEDKSNLNTQVHDILGSGDLGTQNENLNKHFPQLDPAMDEMMKNIQKEFEQEPGLQEEFTKWIQGVQEHLGPDLDKINTMSEDEVNQISLPPPRLRAVLDKYIPDTDKYNTLDVGDDLTFELGTKEDMEEGEDGEPIEIEEIKMH